MTLGSKNPRIARLFAVQLLPYHVLIILGGLLIIRRSFLGPFPPTLTGIALIISGLAWETVVVLQSVHQLRASGDGSGTTAPGPIPKRATKESQRLCLGCAWSGTSPNGLCRRCGRLAIQLPNLA